MTRQTLSKQIRVAIEKRLDSYGLLAGGLAEEIACDVALILESRKRAKDGTCPVEWMAALLQLCGANPYTASPGLRAQISDCGKALIASGAELADLGEFAGWWKNYTRGWSIDCAHPTPKQVRDSWGKFQQAKPVSDTICPLDGALSPEQVGRSFSPRV